MHPILTRPERLALYLGAWVVVGILIAGVLNRQGLTFAEALVLVLPLFLVYSFICLSAWYVCRAVPLRTSGALRVLVACATSSVVAGGHLARRWRTRGLPVRLDAQPGRDGRIATVSRFRSCLRRRCCCSCWRLPSLPGPGVRGGARGGAAAVRARSARARTPNCARCAHSSIRIFSTTA